MAAVREVTKMWQRGPLRSKMQSLTGTKWKKNMSTIATESEKSENITRVSEIQCCGCMRETFKQRCGVRDGKRWKENESRKRMTSLKRTFSLYMQACFFGIIKFQMDCAASCNIMLINLKHPREISYRR